MVAEPGTRGPPPPPPPPRPTGAPPEGRGGTRWAGAGHGQQGRPPAQSQSFPECLRVPCGIGEVRAAPTPRPPREGKGQAVVWCLDLAVQGDERTPSSEPRVGRA